MYRIKHVTHHKPFGLFNFGVLVVNSIIGADIYVIVSQTARLSGLYSILAWLLCGVAVIIISFCFAQVANLISQSGGSFIYAEKAFGKFAGFMTGWILFISEWVGLVVYPIAFVQYMHFFFQPNALIDGAIKIVFVIFLAAVNLVGTSVTAKANKAITLIKIFPLFLLILSTIVWSILNPETVAYNLQHVSTNSSATLGQTMLLAFWAYAGFEMAVLPSSEVEDPKKTIPKGLIYGIFTVITTYILVNISVFFALPNDILQTSSLPLADLMTTIFNNKIASLTIIIGGCVSISGIAFASIFELSRLLQKMSSEGFLFKALGKGIGKEKIPYLAIIIESVLALVVSLVADIRSAISFSVILLRIIYLLTGLANWKLHTKLGKIHIKYRIISALTIIISLLLILQGEIKQYIFAGGVILLGVAIYFFKRESKILSDRKNGIKQPTS